MMQKDSGTLKRNRSMERTAPAVTRAERVRSVLREVRAAARERGRWEATDVGGGQTARTLVVDFDGGIQARTTTRFSGVSMTPAPAIVAAACLEGLAPPKIDDSVVDVYMAGVGKVLPAGIRDGIDEIISMTSGPWEAAFGLPARPWPPAVQRRLERGAGG